MPEVFYKFNDQIKETVYSKYAELPRNIKIFISELERMGLKGIKFTRYSETEYYTEGDEGYSNDLNLEINIDAEKFAKGEFLSLDEVEQKANIYARSTNVDNFYILAKYVNKKEFADKFLKELKLYLKQSPVRERIHQIRFDLKKTWDMKIEVIKKSNYLFHTTLVNTEIREKITEFLEVKGYPKLKVVIV